MRKFYFILIVLTVSLITNLNAQDTKKNSLKVSSDFVSSYIWRGAICDLSPNIQPTLAFTKGGFEIGAWGSTNFSGSYKEVDLCALYTIKGFTIGVYDYYWPAGWSTKNYFKYDKDKTGHIIEGMLKYSGPEAFPLTITASSWVYGDDKFSAVEYPTDSTKWGDNRYSSYFELLYPLKISDNKLEVYLGMTPQKGYYGNGLGVINMGFTGYRNIKITDNFELPVKASLIANPQAEKVFFVLGITI